MKKRILVDINHPAHVHYFRNCIRLLREQGHQVAIVSRDRYPARELLEAYGEPFVDRGRGGGSLAGKLLYLPRAEWKIFSTALRFRANLFLSFGTPYPNHVAWLLRKPSINFHDTENAGLALAFTRPFARAFCTPACFGRDLGRKHFRFRGYMELAYLHPNQFVPDPTACQDLGLAPAEPYVILRFVSWQATHDIGHPGLSLAVKREALRRLSPYARVFVSSEKELPPDLEPYRIRIRPERMHHVLAGAALLYGESATMASECAVLGTPAIYLDNDGRGYTREEEERYGLVFNFKETPAEQARSLDKAEELLRTPNRPEEWQRRRSRLLADSIDVTAFMTWFLNEYPRSAETLRADPGYADAFRTGPFSSPGPETWPTPFRRAQPPIPPPPA